MPQTLAFEWDDTHLWAVVSNVEEGKLTGTQAVCLPLGDEESHDRASVAGTALRDWLSEQKLSKLPAVAIVRRSQVELQNVSLPPAPSEELPDMVQFQVRKDLASQAADAPIDYIVLEGDEKTPYQILAAAVAENVLTETKRLCEAAGLKLQRIVLRPCATTSFALQHASQMTRPSLVLHASQNTLDLIAVQKKTAHLIRSVRLPGDSTSSAVQDTIIREVRSTLAAVRHDAGSKPIEQIILCGGEHSDSELAKRLSDATDVKTEVLDVSKACNLKLDNDTKDVHPFAPMLGALADEAAETLPAFDFLNPKQRAVESNAISRYAVLGLAALLLVGCYVGWQYYRVYQLDQQIDTVKESITTKNKYLTDNKKEIDQAKRIASWNRSDVIWLDELDKLSTALRPLKMDAKEYRSDQDVIVTSLRMNSKKNGGMINLDTVTKNKNTMAAVEKRLRDKKHGIGIVGGGQNSDIPNYGWSYSAAVQITKPDPLQAKK